jgi:hypothetical protein
LFLELKRVEDTRKGLEDRALVGRVIGMSLSMLIELYIEPPLQYFSDLMSAGYVDAPSP